MVKGRPETVGEVRDVASCDDIYLHHGHADTQSSSINQLDTRNSAIWRSIMWQRQSFHQA